MNSSDKNLSWLSPFMKGGSVARKIRKVSLQRALSCLENEYKYIYIYYTNHTCQAEIDITGNFLSSGAMTIEGE